jgi:hypothetical protein
VGRLLIRKVQVRVLPGAPNLQVSDLIRLSCLLSRFVPVILSLAERQDRESHSDPTVP